jgi:GDP-L-fucose synthase|tara:strand:+ start:307 stop:1227 length:921 start_codon:yes stop_codon:yes gene_type:complete
MAILITGGTGMIGTAFREYLPQAYYLSSKECDLKNLEQACDIINKYKPERVIHLAARVGGVSANSSFLGEFYFENCLINTNTLESCRKNNVKKVLSLLSTCIFPDKVVYPITEDQLHNGEPHASNFAYAYAKRMLDVQSRAYRKQYGCNYITAVPNNLYGEHDNFDLEQSHVIPAIIRKVYEAKKHNQKVVLWGDGSPLREFTYSKDLAKVLLFLMDNYSGENPINVGTLEEINIKQIASIIADELRYDGEIVWDTTKPAGQFKKPSDKKQIQSLGWTQDRYLSFAEGIKKTCEWFKENYPNVRGV